MSENKKELREQAVLGALGFEKVEKIDPEAAALTEGQIRSGADAREALFNQALGIKVEAKPKEKKAEERSPFSSVKKQISDLQAYLTGQGITYYPLQEFSQKVEQWEKEISLKESDADDLGLDDEFSQIKKSGTELVDEVKRFQNR